MLGKPSTMSLNSSPILPTSIMIYNQFYPEGLLGQRTHVLLQLLVNTAKLSSKKIVLMYIFSSSVYFSVPSPALGLPFLHLHSILKSAFITSPLSPFSPLVSCCPILSKLLHCPSQTCFTCVFPLLSCYNGTFITLKLA